MSSRYATYAKLRKNIFLRTPWTKKCRITRVIFRLSMPENRSILYVCEDLEGESNDKRTLLDGSNPQKKAHSLYGAGLR